MFAKRILGSFASSAARGIEDNRDVSCIRGWEGGSIFNLKSVGKAQIRRLFPSRWVFVADDPDWIRVIPAKLLSSARAR